MDKYFISSSIGLVCSNDAIQPKQRQLEMEMKMEMEMEMEMDEVRERWRRC